MCISILKEALQRGAGRLVVACLLLIQTAAFSAAVYAQDARIIGSVTDDQGIPLIGASVLAVELSVGSVTDENGRYSIDIDLGEIQSVTLRVQFIGFRTQNRPITLAEGEQTQDFQLVLDPLNLEEVVVTGIASETSKARSEVSVSRVDADKLTKQTAYVDLNQMMAAKVPGVSVQPASGNIGSGVRFVMRSGTGLNGNGQPIVYVDGIRINSEEYYGVEVWGQGQSMLANLNPEDIESIDVLPGPAGAALYGTSGSNGVVLITTKRGSVAGAGSGTPSVTYKMVLGQNRQEQKYTRVNSAHPEEANDLFQVGGIQQHSFSVSGGAPSLRYFGSADVRAEDGHFENNRQDRRTFRLNLESFRGEKFVARLNSSHAVNENRAPINDDFLLGGLHSVTWDQTAFPIVSRDYVRELYSDRKISTSALGGQLDFKPIQNLELKASAGYELSSAEETAWLPFAADIGLFGARSLVQQNIEQYTYDFSARYDWRLPAGVQLRSLVGSQLFERRLNSLMIERENFATELIRNVAAGETAYIHDERLGHSREAGMFAQQEASKDETYFLTLGLRRDFASTIGAEAPSIWYPKVSGALRLDQIIDLPSAIRFLKLRSAYGATGQLPNPLDNARLRWRSEPSGFGSAAAIAFIGNESVKPERVQEIEFGIEAELFGWAGIELTYFRQKVKDSIVGLINAPSTGMFVSPSPFNIGKSEGQGLEASITANPVRRRNLSLDVTLLWSWQKNEVLDMGEAQPILDRWWKINTIGEGLPKNAFRDWTSEPTFDDSGRYSGSVISQSDVDGDGSPDPVLMGIPYPKHNGSFTLNLVAFRNFSSSVLFDWSLGNSVFNNADAWRSLNGTHQARNRALVRIGEVSAAAVGLEGEDLPILNPGSQEYVAAATVVAETEYSSEGLRTQGNFVEDADFLKLREISIRYNFTDLLKRHGLTPGVQSISLSVSGRNLWKSTKYSGIDPEVNIYGADDLTRGHDYATLAQPKIFYASLSVRY